MRSARWLFVGLAALLLACSGSTTAPAPSGSDNVSFEAVHGRWEGTYTFGAIEIEFGIACGDYPDIDDDGLECTVDIPVQALAHVALHNESFEDGRVHFELGDADGDELDEQFVAVWDGVLSGDTIEGDFEQIGLSGTFRLERVGPFESVTSETFTFGERPYREEAVEFQSGEATLSGTLTLPGWVLPGSEASVSAPFPAVVLVSGSGPQTRDYEPGPFPFFQVMADHLAREGIASLRYDDPGISASVGDLFETTVENRARILAAAVSLLAGHAEIRADMIGLVGHSEGGTVAPLAAAESGSVSFLVLLAGTGLPGDEIVRAQTELILRTAGTPEEEIAAVRALQELTISAVVSDTGWEEVESEMRRRLREDIEQASEVERQAMGISDLDAFVDAVVAQQLAVARSPWFRSFLTYDPRPVLAQTTLPVLAVFAELDVQVPAEPNAAAMRQALTEAGNPDFTVITLGDTNHAFQAAVTGGLAEQGLDAEFVPGFLDTITEWMADRSGAERPRLESPG